MKSICPVGARNTLELTVDSNRRQEARGRDAVGTIAEIVRLYASLVGDVPYDALNVAMVESNLPGGHAPAYVAVINNPLPTTPFTWRNDPANFSSFPEFFLAHELAHQWFGQAVGWKNYHEQWLSEGFAQYFAVLFAERTRSRDDFEGILRQLRRTATSNTRSGPVWLGYRLGHLQGDGRIFRALVGETLHAFVKRVRLERALTLMSRRDGSSLTDIALACGFSSSSDFSRSFRGHFGVPPSVILAIWGRETRVGHYEQPVFAWR